MNYCPCYRRFSSLISWMCWRFETLYLSLIFSFSSTLDIINDRLILRRCNSKVLSSCFCCWICYASIFFSMLFCSWFVSSLFVLKTFVDFEYYSDLSKYEGVYSKCLDWLKSILVIWFGLSNPLMLNWSNLRRIGQYFLLYSLIP